jgi:hypothetical protein
LVGYSGLLLFVSGENKMNMELCSENMIATTTAVVVNSGTNTVSYLFDRNKTKQYKSSGLNNDNTASSILLNFATQTVDRIVLQNINWKSFKIEDTLGNVITLPVGNVTTTASWISNSATTLFIYMTASSRYGFGFYATQTMVANEEKKCGEIWILRQETQFEKNPSASQYKSAITNKQVEHEMADGGTSIINFSTKFKADIDLTFVTDTFKTDLKEAFDNQPFVFIPFPTSSSSFGDQIYEVNWVGDWDFETPQKDYYIEYGWKGTIRLRETPL